MSKIEWTDDTWNPVVGCSLASPGCTHCYAMPMAARLERMGIDHYAGLTQPSKAGPVWTGKVALAPESILTKPLRWNRPRRVFVNSMGDLFHEDVPDAWIDRAFAVMALCPQHVFQVLTKRSARMRRYCSNPTVSHQVAQAMDAIVVDQEHEPAERWANVPGWEAYEASTHGNVRRDGWVLKQTLNPLYERPTVTLWQDNVPKTVYVHTLVLTAHRGPAPEGTEARHRNGNRQDNRLANLQWATGSANQQDKVRHGANGGPAKLTRKQAAEIRALRRTGLTQQAIADQYGVSRSLISMIESRAVWPDALTWPLTNVWLGVSAEDQARADARIPDLLETPAAVRFVSAEPLLGQVDLTVFSRPPSDIDRRLEGLERVEHFWIDGLTGQRGVVMKEGRVLEAPGDFGHRIDWVIVGGESGPGARPMHPDWARAIRDQCVAAQEAGSGGAATGSKRGPAFFFKQWGEWAPYDRGQIDSGQLVAPGATDCPPQLFGKRLAGRMLDGREWNEFPAGERTTP